MKKFWFVAMLFTAFWVLYGLFDFTSSLLKDGTFDMQPIYLMIAMFIIFFSARKEYNKFTKGEEGCE